MQPYTNKVQAIPTQELDMFTTHLPEPDLHAQARQRARHLRREAIDHAWVVLGRLLRRVLPHLS